MFKYWYMTVPEVTDLNHFDRWLFDIKKEIDILSQKHMC